MASKTKRTKIIRKHKKSKAGATRKRALRSSGSTKSAKVLFAD